VVAGHKGHPEAVKKLGWQRSLDRQLQDLLLFVSVRLQGVASWLDGVSAPKLVRLWNSRL
jgi:hypothetical protein